MTNPIDEAVEELIQKFFIKNGELSAETFVELEAFFKVKLTAVYAAGKEAGKSGEAFRKGYQQGQKEQLEEVVRIAKALRHKPTDDVRCPDGCELCYVYNQALTDLELKLTE